MTPVPLVRQAWRQVAAYAGHRDPMVAACNSIALVVAFNQPFYPFYVRWAVSENVWPTLFTFLSTPFFLAVPLLARRSPTAGRALLVLAGIGNTILSTQVLGRASGVEVFLIPCALIAATFFRVSERLIGLALVACAMLAYLALDGVHSGGAVPYTAVEQGAFLRLNAMNAGMLTVFVGLVASGLLSRQACAGTSGRG